MGYNTDEYKITMNLPLFLYVIYLSFLILCDTVNFGVYILGYNKVPLPMLLILAILLIFLVYKIKGHISLEKINLDLIAKLVLIIIFIVAFVRGILPDLSYDTMNARVFWQFPGFQDNIDYNTFPAAFTFFFPLPDRIFYYPRILLGYRLGTMTNALLLALTFLETRNLIESLLGERLFALKQDMEAYGKETQAVVSVIFNKSFLAAIASLLYYIIAELGTYMVDIAALPLLLILVRKVVVKTQDVSPGQFAFTAYMAGICFALKMSNVIFLAPILLIYIINNRKHIRFKHFLLCIMIGIYPSISYLIYAYISTGNPVYWTFNAVFKSPYYVDIDFKDVRWGPDNIKDFILWPWKLVVAYDSRVSELSRLPQIYILLGVISSIYLAVKACLKKAKDKGMAIFIILFWIFYALWLYSTGYPRYAIICEVMAAIISIAAICELLLNQKKAIRTIAVFMMLALVLQMQLNYIEGLNNRYDWSWRGTTAENITNGKLAANAKWLLKDRGTIGTDEQHEKVDMFLESYTNSQYMKMFNEDIPILNGSYVQTYLDAVYGVKGETDYLSYYRNKVVETLEEGKGVYEILQPGHMRYAFDLANAWGLRITECEYVESYYTWDRCPVLIRYELATEENEYYPINYVDIDISGLNETANARLEGIVYLDSAVSPSCTLVLKVEWSDGGNIEHKIELSAGQLYDLSQYFSIPHVDPDDRVYLQVVEDGIDVNIMNLGIAGT